VQAWIDNAAERRPDHPALITAGEVLTWAQLAERARTVSNELGQRGVGRGDGVPIELPAGVGFVALLHGALRLGAVAVPVDLRLNERERAAVRANAERVSEGATVIHTSGTTGQPRPVTLTGENWGAHAQASAAALGHPPEERWLCCLPLSHVGGLGVLIRAVIHATTVVLHERFDTEAVRAALEADALTGVSLVPTMLRRLLDAGLEPAPGLRCALIGGGPVASDLLKRAAALPIAQTYGLTEACSQVSTERPGEGSGTAGRPLAGTEVRIEGGEILVRGRTVAPGARDPEGWLHTGDLGTLDAEGRLTVVGRRSETIVTGGENVAPVEVEAVLEGHPAVAEAAVFARPDPEWGERVVAAVVLRVGATAAPAELRAHAAERLARFKVPKEVELREALPRTASGKVRRGELR
jgi:O-succinylbenzoic acid--CoA ligase